ncbi:MAG: substrate-binding domain-containing protein [Deltaproteobacteria bacterium]|nr:substrate-binding domain-containing protein [Deltaproteobacteria bacterium]
MVSLEEKARREISGGDGGLSGVVSVGSGELRSFSRLAEALASFREIHPQVSYEVFSGSADGVRERIENGLVDVGLLLEPVDLGNCESFRIAQREEWGVLARDGSGLAGKEHAGPEDLAGTPLFVPNRPSLREALSRWFGDLYGSADIVCGYNLLYNVALMARKGLGAAITLMLDSSYAGLRFVPLRPKLEGAVVLAWKKSAALSRTTGAFIEHAKNALQA